MCKNDFSVVLDIIAITRSVYRLSHFRAALEHESVVVMFMCWRETRCLVAVLLSTNLVRWCFRLSCDNRGIFLSLTSLHMETKAQGQPLNGTLGAGKVSLKKASAEKLLFQHWSVNLAPLIQGWSSLAVHHVAVSSLAKPVPFIWLCD